MNRDATGTSRAEFRSYLAQMQSFPVLTPEQEFSLARRYRDHKDRAALHQLTTSHLRLVAKIAFAHRGYGFPVPDLISEGSIGLIEAIERFDTNRGCRLATYAIWWIRARIRNFILRSWSLVRVGTTARQRKLFFNLRRLKAELGAIDEGDLSPEMTQRIANDLEVRPAEVAIMNQRLSRKDALLGDPDAPDLPVVDDEHPEDRLVDRHDDERRRALVLAALAQLTARERDVIEARRLRDEPLPLTELAARYRVSPERIRQIEQAAFGKLQKQVLTMQQPTPFADILRAA